MEPTEFKRLIRQGLGRVARTTLGLRAKNSLVVLTYHRVLPPNHPERQYEQPGMYVSPAILAMHLHVLQRHFEIVDLGEWIARRLDGRPLPERACSITFDDGWRDNYLFALPVIQRAGVPVTVFLVSDLVGTSNEFWPNRLARLLIRSRTSRSWAISSELLDLIARLGVHLPSDCAAITMTHVDQAICACKSVSDQELQQLVSESAVETGDELLETRRTLLNLPEINEMARTGQIRFGSHGRRHIRLKAGLPTQQLRQEIVDSREALREITGQPIELFCYPNGDYSADAISLVRELYQAAVTTEPGWNVPASDLHLMRRMSIHEDIASDQYSFLARVGGLA